MKKLIFLVVTLAALSAGPVSAQTSSATTTDVPTFAGDLWNVLIGEGLTNLSTTIYGTYTPSVKQGGGGIVVTRNIPLGQSGVSTGIGLGVDYYNQSFYALNGQVGLNVAMRPFSNWGSFGSNIVITPFTFVAVGTPFGGQSQNAGGLETVEAVGASVHLATVIGASLETGYVYGTRQGLGNASGVFHGVLLDLTWKF